MVASQATMTESPETVALEMSAHMVSLAESGDWPEVENIAVRLRTVVMSVPETERRGVLLSVQRNMQKVIAAANSARHDVTGRLSALRRGQAATRAYEIR